MPKLAPEDFYYENDLLIFTEKHHLKRGTCCGNGCRHCPYGGEEFLLLRSAAPEEFEAIYEMGFDTWADGTSLADYLASCRTSPKYRRNEWFILTNGKNIYSALLLHDFSKNTFGIGSIVTAPRFRKKGYATSLITKVLSALDTRNAEVVYLYSDINPQFYGRFGFAPLPANQQKYSPRSICMARIANSNNLNHDLLVPPAYF